MGPGLGPGLGPDSGPNTEEQIGKARASSLPSSNTVDTSQEARATTAGTSQPVTSSNNGREDDRSTKRRGGLLRRLLGDKLPGRSRRGPPRRSPVHESDAQLQGRGERDGGASAFKTDDQLRAGAGTSAEASSSGTRAPAFTGGNVAASIDPWSVRREAVGEKHNLGPEGWRDRNIDCWVEVGLCSFPDSVGCFPLWTTRMKSMLLNASRHVLDYVCRITYTCIVQNVAV